MRQQHLNHARPQLRPFGRLICLSAMTLSLALPALAQTDQILPPIGGSGGGGYVSRCPYNWHLAGFELRTGDDVDAIRPLCVVAYGPADVGPIEVFSEMIGGTGGGNVVRLVCPKDAPIVTGMHVQAEGVDTIVVNNIRLWCGMAATTQQENSAFPAALYDGPDHPNSGSLGFIVGPASVSRSTGVTSCPAGLVGVGINGRSGIWLDSVGLICGPPKLTARGSGGSGTLNGGLGSNPFGRTGPTINSLGRTPSKVTTAPTGGPPRSICDAARDARARNSPAAPGLEAQCRAAGGDSSVKAPAIDVTQLDEFHARGEAIANQDPRSVELRNQQREGLARRGFDIGMAAAEGQTQPGPNKQRIHDSLSPTEQKGFRIAVAFSLERNRNADFAARGAAIAELDPTVAERRTAEADAFYWLGFDIATGIFGDPALGAQGNTATGPNSLGIRDGLSAAGQRGFNASVTLHLSRDYTP